MSFFPSGKSESSQPDALVLTCAYICSGQDRFCGGICMKFMLCILNMKWEGFLSLLEVGAAVGVHREHGLVQLRAADSNHRSSLDRYLNITDPRAGFVPVDASELSHMPRGNASLAVASAPQPPSSDPLFGAPQWGTSSNAAVADGRAMDPPTPTPLKSSAAPIRLSRALPAQLAHPELASLAVTGAAAPDAKQPAMQPEPPPKQPRQPRHAAEEATQKHAVQLNAHARSPAQHARGGGATRGRGRGVPAPAGSTGRLGPPKGKDVKMMMRPLPPGCGGGGPPVLPGKASTCPQSGFIGFIPMNGGPIPMPFNYKNLLEGVMQLIDAMRCENYQVEQDPDKYRPGECGWRCSFLQETNCIPRCVQAFSCCSIYKCVRPLFKKGVPMYQALKRCQFEDCRVQMWGCKQVKVDEDPRGYDPLWNKYSVTDTGTYGMNKNFAYNGPAIKAFKAAGKMPPFAERLLPFWKWPYTIEGEVFGARGLMDEKLFPYRIYRMLGGMPFQSVEVQ